MTKLSLITLLAGLAIGVGGATAVTIVSVSPILENQQENKRIDDLISSLEKGDASEPEESSSAESGSNSSSSRSSASSSSETSVPEDKGTLKNNIFELEEMEFAGVSQNAGKNFGHICSVNSTFFNTAFGGNICIRNVTSKDVTNTFTLKFDSSAAYKVAMDIRVASRYSNNAWPEEYLSAGMYLSVNGKDVDLTSVMVPASSDAGKIGGNNYFNMNTVSVPITIAKGSNTVVLTPSSAYLNVDYVNIRTSATLSGFTPKYFADAEKCITITKDPTTSAKGSIRFSDTECADTANYDLPILSEANGYTLKDGQYSIKILGKTYSFSSGGQEQGSSSSESSAPSESSLDPAKGREVGDIHNESKSKVLPAGVDFFKASDWFTKDVGDSAKLSADEIIDADGNLVFENDGVLDTSGKFPLFYTSPKEDGGSAYTHLFDKAGNVTAYAGDAFYGHEYDYTLGLSASGPFALILGMAKNTPIDGSDNNWGLHYEFDANGKVSLRESAANAAYKMATSTAIEAETSFDYSKANSVKFGINRVDSGSMTIDLYVNGDKVPLAGEITDAYHSLSDDGRLNINDLFSSNGMGQRFGIRCLEGSYVRVSSLATEVK